MTRSTRDPCLSRASPSCTSRVAIPPVSPLPECRRRPSTSPWRNSCTTVRPSDPPVGRGPRSAAAEVWPSDRARVATVARGPLEAATAARADRAGSASGSSRHPRSARRSPRADRAAARTTVASAPSMPTRVRSRIPAGPGTRPTVSTSRSRAPGSCSDARAVASPPRTAAGATAAHVSRVRCASIPRNPPPAQRRTSGATASRRGVTPPRASTACSATPARSSLRRATRWTAARALPWAPRARTAATAVIGSGSDVVASSRPTASGPQPRATSSSRSAARKPSRMLPDDLTAQRAAATSMPRP